MTDEIRYLGDLQRLELKPGDRFVLTTPGAVTADFAQRLQECWAAFVGDGAPKLLILEHGMKLGVINDAGGHE